MKKKFSTGWKSSVQRRKQRKYGVHAPLHTKQGLVRAHLDKELRKKHKRRSAGVKKGDKVKILRGTFKGKTGKIDRIDIKKGRIYITGIEIVKKDGTKVAYPVRTSNVLLIELKMDDKMREKAMKV